MIRNYNVLRSSMSACLKNLNVTDLGVSLNQVTGKNKKSSIYLGLLLIMTFLFSGSSMAQVSGYAYTESVGTYTPITGGTVVATATAASGAASLDDTIFNLPASTIPFPFTYDGVPYTGLNISTNGFVTFGATAPGATNYTPVSNTAAYAGAISAYGGDLNSLFNILGNTGQIRYETVGTSPSQEFVIQWSNFRPFSTSTSTTLFWRWNFQIRLHQNGTVNIVYDANFAGAPTASSRQVGLRGPNNTFATNVINRLITSGTHTWNTSVAGTANSSTCAFSTTLLPASGKTFTFTPPAPPACTLPNTISITATSATTATVSWSGAPTAVVEWGTSGCIAGTGATAGACGNVLTGSSPQVITGLTFGTAYSVSVRQDCTGSSNGYSTNVTNAYTHTAGESCTIVDVIPVAVDLASSVNTLLTTGLTADGPAGTCSDGTGNPNKKDRWISFVAPTSGNKIIVTSSAGTISDAVMQVWSACPASGTALGCSDDEVGLMPQLEFCTYTPGATYYIQIWPYSASATGNFNVKVYEDVACAVPPANDECAGVETLLVGAAGSCPGDETSGTTTDATATAGVVKTTCDAFGTYLDVFYKFNSGSNTEVNLSFTNMSGSNEFGLYSGCGTGFLGICSSSNFSNTITGLTINTDYYIVVWANNVGASGSFTLCVSETPAPICVASPSAPADGSTSENPCAVTLSWPSVSGATSYDVYLDAGAGPATTLVSAAQAGTSYVAGLLAGTTAYSWRVVPKNNSGDAVGCADFTFTTTGAPACTVLTTPADLSTICAGTRTFTWAATAGATSYDVYIDSVLVSDDQTGTSYSQAITAGGHTWSVVPSNCIGSATGCVDFSFSASPAPIGDVFADAIVLGPITATTSINGDNDSVNCWNNDYTTASTPGSTQARPSNDVFYQFGITECGSLLDVSTCTSSFDTYIQILDATGARINGDDDSCSAPNSAGSLVTGLALTPGIYYVVVEGFGAADMGTFTLDFTYTAGTPQITYYQDNDNDGFGNIAVSQLGCSQPVGYVTDSSDCNDAQVQYLDFDGDTFGSTVQVACGVANSTDCDDNNSAIYQSALLYTDVDGDGYNVSSAVTCYGATLPAGTSLTTLGSGDCNDAVASINPGAVDICLDGIDNDCNGVIDNVGQPGGCVPTVTTLPVATCGSTITSLTVTITATYVVGAQGYRFRIENLNTNAIQIIDRPVNSFALSNLPGITLGTPYRIDVALRLANVWQPFYGAPCTVNTPSPVSTIGAQCTTTLTSMSQFVYATYQPTVTGYRFRVTNTANSSIQVYDALSGQNRFSFNQLPTRAHSTVYFVEVALRNTDGSYLPYGTGCNITTPAFPTSELILSQCDYTALSGTQSLSAVVISGASNYRFELVNSGLAYSFSIDRPVANFNLNMFPGLLPGTTYTVRVAVRIGGIWGPLTGKPCNITTPGSAPREVIASDEFVAIAYPNPFAENFMFDVKTTAQSSIQIRVYDMLGKQVDNKTVEASDISNIQVGDAYPSGVYNVIVSQGANTQTLRVIKR